MPSGCGSPLGGEHGASLRRLRPLAVGRASFPECPRDCPGVGLSSVGATVGACPVAPAQGTTATPGAPVAATGWVGSLPRPPLSCPRSLSATRVASAAASRLATPRAPPPAARGVVKSTACARAWAASDLVPDAAPARVVTREGTAPEVSTLLMDVSSSGTGPAGSEGDATWVSHTLAWAVRPGCWGGASRGTTAKSCCSPTLPLRMGRTLLFFSRSALVPIRLISSFWMNCLTAPLRLDASLGFLRSGSWLVASLAAGDSTFALPTRGAAPRDAGLVSSTSTCVAAACASGSWSVKLHSTITAGSA